MTPLVAAGVTRLGGHSTLPYMAASGRSHRPSPNHGTAPSGCPMPRSAGDGHWFPRLHTCYLVRCVGFGRSIICCLLAWVTRWFTVT